MKKISYKIGSGLAIKKACHASSEGIPAECNDIDRLSSFDLKL